MRAWLTSQWQRRQSLESYRLGAQRVIREAWKSAIREARGYRPLDERQRYSVIGCLLLIGLFAQPTNIYRIDRAGQGTEHVALHQSRDALSTDGEYLAWRASPEYFPISGGSGSIYYVSSVGSNSNTGTSTSTPFLTVPHALSVMTAGDTCYVRGGTYNVGLDSFPSGTSWTNTVRVAAYPGETVWLSPTSDATSAGGIGLVIWLDGTYHYIDFDGINLDGTNCSGQPFWASTNNSHDVHHIRLQNCEVIAGVTGAGGAVAIGGHTTIGATGGHQILKVTIHGGGIPGNCGFMCNSYGVYIEGPNNLVQDCDIYDVSGQGIQIYNSTGDPADNNIIRNCRIHGLTRSGFVGNDGNGILVSGSNNQVVNCLIYGLAFGSSGGAAIVVFGGSGNQILHCTIAHNTSTDGIRINSGIASTTVKNNLVYLSGTAWSDSGTGTIRANNLDDGTNPLFVNAGAGNFHLQASSPAIDLCPLLPSVLFDRDGGARPIGSGADAGCYEYGSTPTGGTDYGGDPIAPPPPGGPPPPVLPPSPGGVGIPGDVSGEMAFATNAQLVLPAAAASIALTPSGSAWTSGAWAQISASMPVTGFITGIVIGRVANLAVMEVEIDLGVGGAGSETVIATWKTTVDQWFGHTNENGMVLPLRLPRAIASGVRLAARLRLSTTNTVVWNVAVTYLASPIVGNLLTTTSTQVGYPAAAAMVTRVGLGSWANTAWVQILASAPADLVLTGVAVGGGGGSGAGPECEVDIGIGGAGSETVITTVRIQTDLACLPCLWLPNPLDAIPAGSRIAARIRSGGTRTFKIAINAVPKPL